MTEEFQPNEGRDFINRPEGVQHMLATHRAAVALALCLFACERPRDLGADMAHVGSC